MNCNNMKNVIIYCRVSTDEQAKSGFSLNHQEESLKKYCDDNGYNVLSVYREDHSAKDFKRPEWTKLKKYAKSNKKIITKILFTKWDRFSRNIEEALKEIREFDSIDIEINASEQNLDRTNSDSKLILAVYLSAGEVERDKIASRTKMGTYQAKCEGYYASKAPFGYVSVRYGSKTQQTQTKGKRTMLVPDENAHFVTRAFNEVATGLKPAEHIRKQLKEEGMMLEKSAFNTMLKNIVYAGKIEVPEYKKNPARLVDAVHEPLIDIETFLKVQEVFKNKRWKNIKTTDKENLFPIRQFLVCDCCGSHLTGSYSKGRNSLYGYYHCRNGCKTRIRKEKVEERMSDMLAEIQINSNIKELYQEILTDYENGSNGIAKSELIKKKEMKRQLEDNLNKADDLLLSNQIPSERYASIVERNTTELKALELEIESLMSNNERLKDYIESGLGLIENLNIFFNESDNEGKIILISSLFKGKIIMGNEVCRTTSVNEVVNVLTRNSKAFESLKNEKAAPKDSFSAMVPGAGIEPARPKAQDFESSASTSSATRACLALTDS
jgi:site-specific DNA recombinase